MFESRSIMHVAPQYHAAFREFGLDADAVFSSPLIKAWRSLDDRENCTLDATLRDGKAIRWHVKRYAPARGFTTPADDEVNGHRSLAYEKIPTAPLVGWGTLRDRRSFVIFEDLAGYTPADKLIESGAVSFDELTRPTAELAGRLHRVGLHHRDLYLCHFLVRRGPDNSLDVRLIDTARVRRLPPSLTRGRWVVKDVAQFWYSTTKHASITDNQRELWLMRYVSESDFGGLDVLRRKVERKVASIARHDRKLRVRQPTRNVSIPTSTP